MNAPKEIWVVVDKDGYVHEQWENKAYADDDARILDRDCPEYAPHTVHRYVKEDEK